MFKKIIGTFFLVMLFFIGSNSVYAENSIEIQAEEYDSNNFTNCELNGEPIPCDQMPAWIIGSIFIFAGLIFVIALISIIALWKIFVKAGKPGWAAIVPIYNIVVMLEIIAKPLWWVFLMFIPFVNIVIVFIVWYEIVKNFGKGTGFFLGVIFLSFIFIPILGFGKSVYKRPIKEIDVPLQSNISSNVSNV